MKDTGFWVISRVFTGKGLMQGLPLSKAPQDEAGALMKPRSLARAAEGRWECLGKRCVSRWSSGWSKVRALGLREVKGLPSVQWGLEPAGRKTQVSWTLTP